MHRNPIRSPKRAALVLSLLGTIAAFPSSAVAQVKDHTWSPPSYDVGSSLTAAPAPVVTVPGSTSTVTAPQKKLVEKDGSASFPRAGDYTFAIPDYTTIQFIVDGAGGSAARPVTPIAENPTRYEPDFGTPGNDGSNSALWNLGMVGAGGGFGNGVTAIYRGGCYPKCSSSYDTIGNNAVTMTFYRGTDGGASGGDVNTPGGANNGGAATEAGGRNGGGNGGRAIRTFTKGQAGAPVTGQVVSMHVGAGGEPAVVTEPMRIKGMTTKPGGDGAVFVNWKYLAYE